MQLIIKDKKTRTAVICPVVKTDSRALTSFDIDEREEEARGLVEAMGQAVVFCGNFKVSKVIPRSFFGKGVV